MLTLSCSENNEVINLLRANYGRFSITICNEHGDTDWSVNCMSHRSLRALHSKWVQLLVLLLFILIFFFFFFSKNFGVGGAFCFLFFVFLWFTPWRLLVVGRFFSSKKLEKENRDQKEPVLLFGGCVSFSKEKEKKKGRRTFDSPCSFHLAPKGKCEWKEKKKTCW